MYNSWSSNNSGWKSSVTANLLIINILLFVASWIFTRKGIDLNQYLGLHYWRGSDFNVAQVVTYMFMHANVYHIFFNMFTLWVFGRTLEHVMGAKRFLFYYISCGIGAAITQEVVWQIAWADSIKLFNPEGFVVMQGAEALEYATQAGMLNDYFNSMVTIGASGAVFGILLAFAMIFPNVPLYLFFIPIPIKAKWMVLGYGIIELFFGINGISSSVAHFAHLGGMIFGLIILLYWKHKKTIGGRPF